MKELDAGFDSVYLDIIFDYYGGGAAEVMSIYCKETHADIAKRLEDYLVDILRANTETVLIIEFEEVK